MLGTFGLDLSRVRQAVIQLLSGYHETTEQVFSTSEITVEQEITFTGNEIRPATCAFCGAPSPQCARCSRRAGGALICERCLNSPVTRRDERRGRVFGRTLGNQVSAEDLAARVEPNGPPPTDIETARAAVIEVFERRMQPSADGRSLPNVVGGENRPYQR